MAGIAILAVARAAHYRYEAKANENSLRSSVKSGQDMVVNFKNLYDLNRQQDELIKQMSYELYRRPDKPMSELTSAALREFFVAEARWEIIKRILSSDRENPQREHLRIFVEFYLDQKSADFAAVDQRFDDLFPDPVVQTQLDAQQRSGLSSHQLRQQGLASIAT